MKPSFLISLAKTLETLAYSSPGMEVLDISISREAHPETGDTVVVAHMKVTQYEPKPVKGGDPE